MKAVRQAVDEEAANELVRIERHHLGRIAMTIIAPAEGYAGLVGTDQATISDRDPVGVAAEIGQDMLGRAKRRLRVDDPVFATQLPDHCGEGIGIIESIKLAGEAKSSGHMCRLKPLEEESTEQGGENMDGQEEVRSAT